MEDGKENSKNIVILVLLIIKKLGIFSRRFIKKEFPAKLMIFFFFSNIRIHTRWERLLIKKIYSAQKII
jgi:hypothetical protein